MQREKEGVKSAAAEFHLRDQNNQSNTTQLLTLIRFLIAELSGSIRGKMFRIKNDLGHVLV